MIRLKQMKTSNSDRTIHASNPIISKKTKLILNVIDKNYLISHTDLLKLVEKDVAKHTVEKILKQMHEDGMITHHKDGRKKRYLLSNPDQKTLEEDMLHTIKNAKNLLDEIGDSFSLRPYDEEMEMRRNVVRFLDDLKWCIASVDNSNWFHKEGVMADQARERKEILSLMRRVTLPDDVKEMLRECLNDGRQTDVLCDFLSRRSELDIKRKQQRSSSARTKTSIQIKNMDSLLQSFDKHVYRMQVVLKYMIDDEVPLEDEVRTIEQIAQAGKSIEDSHRMVKDLLKGIPKSDENMLKGLRESVSKLNSVQAMLGKVVMDDKTPNKGKIYRSIQLRVAIAGVNEDLKTMKDILDQKSQV